MNNSLFAEKFTEFIKNPNFSSKDHAKQDKTEAEFINYFGMKDFCGNAGENMFDGRTTAKKLHIFICLFVLIVICL